VSLRLALLLLVVAPLAPFSQARLDQLVGHYRAQEEVLYLWSGEHVRRLVPGFDNLAADLYWLRTVQYFGGQRRFDKGKRFELLQPLVDITTTLDPRLEIAYRYGAVFLSEPPPLGAGRPHEGIAVLQKGVAALPESWRLRQDLGFFHYLFLHDAETASRVLLEAADLPGAAFWLRTLAADLVAKGGDRAASRRMWQQMYEQAEEGIIRDNARLRLLILDTLDLRDALRQAVAEFQRRNRRLPTRLTELVRAGLWRGPLVDRADYPFGYDARTGRVFVQESSPMWRPE